MFLGSMEQWAYGLGAVEKSSEPRRAHCEPVVAQQHHSEEEVGINCNDIEPQRSCKLDAAILHVIGFLGEALARMTAIQAMEEYGVSQYASSIQFINKLITAARSPVQPCTADESTPDICSTIEVSTEETDGQSVDAVHEDGKHLASLTKSLDWILAEAKFLRTSSTKSFDRQTLSPYLEVLHGQQTQAKVQSKGNIARNAELLKRSCKMRPMKSKVRHGEDMCSKQSAGLPIVWNATVPNQWRRGESPSQPRGQESGAPENCTQAKETLRFPVSFQKLLTWFHAREKVTSKRVPNVALQESTSMAMENALLVDQGCIQEMEKEKFLACLWHVGSRPADALSKKKETAHNIECLQRLLKVLAQYTDSSHMRSLLRVAPEGMIVKHRDACMQAFLSPPKYQHEVQVCNVLCRTGRFEMRGVGKNFDQHCADSWLSDDCWSVEGPGMPEIGPSELQIQVTPNSKPEQVLALAKLMHTVRTTLFQCHFEAVAAQCLLPHPCTRISLCSSFLELFQCRLAHAILCKEGRALFVLSQRIEVAKDTRI